MTTKHRTDSRDRKLTEKRAKLHTHADLWAGLKADVARGAKQFWAARGMDEPVPQSNFDPFAVKTISARANPRTPVCQPGGHRKAAGNSPTELD